MKHELKILECYADAKVYGDKLFEIRDNTDRGFQKGDIVKYSAVDKIGFHVYHDIEDKLYEITYVTNYQQKEGYVVFGEREIKKELPIEDCLAQSKAKPFGHAL